MSSDDQHISLADDLARRSDDELVELLTARPDLAAPPPQGASVLGQRALAAASITLAGETLDLLGVAVLEQILALGISAQRTDPIVPVDANAVVEALSGRADADDIDERIDLLHRLALVWGPRDGLLTAAHTPSALPWKGRHLIGEFAERTPEELRSLLDECSERETGLLETLSRGPALGRSRDAAPDADPDAPVPRLIRAGLLARIDEQTVELPPTVGALLRSEPPLRTDDLREPTLEAEHTPTSGRRFGAVDIDAAAGGEALELIRHTTSILRTMGATPAAVLRSGSLGVRELRRIAKATGLTPQRCALVIELLGWTRLVDVGFPDPPPPGDVGEQMFAPTSQADAWLHTTPDRQWSTLLGAWLEMPRRAWQVGTPDREGNNLTALSDDLHDPYAVVQRHHILSMLATADTAVPVDVDTLCASIAWHHPRHIRRFPRHLVTETLEEARQLGVVAHASLTDVGRASLTEDDSDVVAAMDKALPEPVDHFLTQADLTITVPGPMTPELAEQVELVADLESGGAASMYRITEDSVRRALDAGRSSSELIAMFTTHSRTPVPQSLTYLIEDVARRHGQLRVGVASAFIRCEDATLLTSVLRSDVAEQLALRALAPTVAVSPADVRDVIDALRSAGFAPSGEDSTGTLVDLRDRGSRVSQSRARRPGQTRRSVPSSEQIGAVVSRMRAHDRASAAESTFTSGSPVRASGGGESSTALITLAMRAGRRLRIGYVDAHGSASRHVVVPQALGAGQLHAGDPETDDQMQFSLHRITSVELLDA